MNQKNMVAVKYPDVWKNINVRCVALEESKQKPVYDFFKRVFDIAASSLGLVLTSWIFALIAIAIKVEDGGPVFYKQIRVGKDGKFFNMYKFRSMYVDAERMKKQLLDQNEMDGPVFKMANDPRVTKVGTYLRKMSLDELPQLLNILRGEMSLVGPRPPLGYEVMQYDEYAMKRLSVKPGLTCYWQCSGRNSINFCEWMKLDNKYIEERNFFVDILIILKTIPAVFKNEGAC